MCAWRSGRLARRVTVETPATGKSRPEDPPKRAATYPVNIETVEQARAVLLPS